MNGASFGLERFDLERFITAQAPVYAQVLAELRGGSKVSHWMWFIFPQIAGLGFSATSQKYAISEVDEARAYMAHAVLGPRLRECTRLVMAVEGKTAHDIFGNPDDMKLHSSVTLFAKAEEGAGGTSLFDAALTKYFGGVYDEGTLGRM